MCKERICACMLLYVPFLLICMKHDHVLKKLNFDLLTPRIRWGRGVLWLNICYQVAAFVVPFNLMCNMTMFYVLKKLIFDPIP